MATFLLQDAAGIGSDDHDPVKGFIDMVIITNDTGVGIDDAVGGLQRVTYGRTVDGPPQLRFEAMVNTAFSPDYGSGPQNVDTVVIAGLHGFTLDDGTSMENNGTALAPQGSGLAGADLNPTDHCLVIYDTQITACVARAGSGGDLDLPISSPLVLYHEFSHAFRIVNNTLLALSATCDPSSPEENAAIVDENDLRTDLANRSGDAAAHRDPNIHCGRIDDECSSCCIIATLVSRSLDSPQVRSLRAARDYFVRGNEVGHAFFRHFFHDYYAFSPQVCTIMAGSPQVPQHVLEGFIDPLLGFWKILIERGKLPMDSADLGREFIDLHASRAQAEARRAALLRTGAWWLQGDAVDDAVPAELLTLLRQRAWPSEYMQWALVAPVRIYHVLLLRYLDGADADAIGHEFSRQLDAWAPEVPISEVWAALPAAQVSRELAFCENALLQSANSQRRFRHRLAERFYDITAVAAVLARRSAAAGSAS